MPAALQRRLDALFRSDPLARSIGAELATWAPGSAEVRAVPGDAALNFLGTVHGGVLFSLADIAFAVANNSWGRMCVALSVDVQFLRPGRPGRQLRATAVEQSRSRRIASYALRVEEGDELVASFHALGYRTERWHFGQDAWPETWRAVA
jgi:acyl-CoA thioesterase